MFDSILHKGLNCKKIQMPAHVCPRCKKRFVRKKFLLDHLARKTPCTARDEAYQQDPQFPCGKCKRVFMHLSSACRHRAKCQGSKKTAKQLISNLTTELQMAQDELVALRGLSGNTADSSIKGSTSDVSVRVDQRSAEDEQRALKTTSVTSTGEGSACDVVLPCIYFGISGSLLVPEQAVDGCLIKFGESQDAASRISKQHVPHFGGFELLDCIPCLNPVAVEKKFKKILDSPLGEQETQVQVYQKEL